MVTREEHDLAMDKVNWDMIETLNKWMKNEKNNLDSFIANPQGHILHSPYVNPDFYALAYRAVLLGQVVSALDVIVSHKKGTGATRTQHDYVLNKIPPILFIRLLSWMESRHESLVNILDTNNMGNPIKEYDGLATFNLELLNSTIDIYKESIEGVKIVIQYKQEEQAPPQEPSEPSVIVIEPSTEAPLGSL